MTSSDPELVCDFVSQALQSRMQFRFQGPLYYPKSYAILYVLTYKVVCDSVSKTHYITQSVCDFVCPDLQSCMRFRFQGTLYYPKSYAIL